MKSIKFTFKLIKNNRNNNNDNNIRRLHEICIKKKRNISSSANRRENEKNVEYEEAKPYSEIPGPKPLPIPYIGNLWRLLPFARYGKAGFLDMHDLLYEDYGPIVKFDGLGTISQVYLFDPESVEKMYRNESIWPIRMGLPSIQYYREVVRKDFYQGIAGLITSNGEEWYKFRKATNQVMMQPKNVKLYLNSVVDVVDDFIERIRYIRLPNDEMPDNFLDEINKMSLEAFTFITLDTRLGCLKNNLNPNSEPDKMITSVRNIINLIFQLDFKPSLWRLYPTKDWKKFVQSMNYCLEFSLKHINAKWEKIKKGDEETSRSILESLLHQTKDPKIPLIMAADTLLAGIDTTSNTLSTILYYLSQNMKKQEKLFDELKILLPEKNSPFTEDVLNNLKYARAVIKESERLNPTSSGNQRVSTKDMVLNNYQIPKGTSLFVCNSVMCKMDKYFKDPHDFIPERWLKSTGNRKADDVDDGGGNNEYKKTHHPFVYLPFGFGQRSCIGKRFAYLELEVAVAKLVRNFKIGYDHEPMTWVTRLVKVPTKPLKFKMTERTE
ncbi:cytochrome P450, putative [Pediculus humanus corporis]|uniref:Cytochrome P450, putative n=1 Tax=Pediculus humanus subsp. corporis TaxID=121224 RepID=E0VDM3_PEDHC|nr:cytochrome P450, putative [Pediculus humanus corporis]EEB11479.1 cytochrome P450, putative [Pediculus humanus corporis]